MSQTNLYHPRVRHSSAYYFAVLRTLIESLQARSTDKTTAVLLNDRGLLSPVGKPWTASSVKQALFKLRNYKMVPSSLHRALMELCFDGVMNASQALILFSPRNPDDGVM